MIGTALDWTFLESFLPDDRRTRSSAARRWPRASSPRSSSRGAAGSTSRRTRPFAPIRLQGGLMDELMRAVEATLFASAEPLTVDEIAEHVGEGDVEIALGQLAAHYEGRGIELVERGGRWHFQTAPDLAHLLRRTREEPRRLSRAATETLAIIAYHEPVSRAEIEAIRGVQISKGTLDVLMDAGWVRPAGRREGPGPAAALCDDAGVPDPLRPGLAARPAGDRRPQGRGPARPARRGASSSFNWKAKTRRTR